MEDVPRQKEGRFLVFGMSSFINFLGAAAFHFANVGKMIFTFQILVKFLLNLFMKNLKRPFAFRNWNASATKIFPFRGAWIALHGPGSFLLAVDRHQYFRSKDFLLSLVRTLPSFCVIVET